VWVAGDLVLARVDLAIPRVDCGRRGKVATAIPVIVLFACRRTIKGHKKKKENASNTGKDNS
jgi:hypothetical protein